MTMKRFNSKKPVAMVAASAALLAGCGNSEKAGGAEHNKDDVAISSLREAPVASGMPETEYTRGMQCAVDAARIAVSEVVRLVPTDTNEPGVYHVDPSNKQSSYVAASQSVDGVMTLKFQVALDKSGQADTVDGAPIAYAVGGEVAIMQQSNESWQGALAMARADQVGFTNGGVRILNLETGEGGDSNNPDHMCTVVDELR